MPTARRKSAPAASPWQTFEAPPDSPEPALPDAAGARSQARLGVAMVTAGALGAFLSFQFVIMLAGAVVWGIVLMLAGASLIVAGAILAHRARSRLTMLWAALAARHGWTHVAKDTNDRPSRYLGFRPFGIGSGKSATNALAGNLDGTLFDLFTYQYTVQSGKHSHTYFCSVVALRMPVDAPSLSIVRETIGHKLVDALGGEDIDVESDEFSRRYWVKCDDRRFAYDILHAPMIDYLLAADDRWSWQWQGLQLVAVRAGALKLEDAEAVLSMVDGFRRRLPRHLLT